MINDAKSSCFPGSDSPSPRVSPSPPPAGRTQGSPLRVPDSPVSDSFPALIGLGGKSGAGKDTAAAYLVEQGYYQLGFADLLKEVVGIAFDLVWPQLFGQLKETVDPRFGKSPRELMQGVGTLFRAVWPEIWIYHVDAIMFDLQAQGRRRFVISDVRLRNEAEWVQKMGGVLVRLERSTDWKVCATQSECGAGVGIPGHVSEVDLDGWPGWDYTVLNQGTVEDLRLAMEAVLLMAGNPAKGVLGIEAGHDSERR